MDFSKYNQIPTEPATAAQIGLAAATLSAMARRGLVEVIPGKPNKYRRIDSPILTILRLCEENKDDYGEFFHLHRKGEKLFMLCSLKDNTILDCWGKPYDVSTVDKVEFRTRKFEL